MIKLRSWGSAAGLIDAAGTGHNDIVIERSGIIVLKTLICSIRAAVAGPILSRLLVTDGSIGNFGLAWNGDLAGLNADKLDGKVLLDTVLSSAEAAIAVELTKPLRAQSGKMTIAIFGGFTLPGVADLSTWAYLGADGDEIPNNPQDNTSLVDVRFR